MAEQLEPFLGGHSIQNTGIQTRDGLYRLSDRNSDDLCVVMQMRVANVGELATHLAK